MKAEEFVLWGKDCWRNIALALTTGVLSANAG
jgi:hypothetical protein